MDFSVLDDRIDSLSAQLASAGEEGDAQRLGGRVGAHHLAESRDGLQNGAGGRAGSRLAGLPP